ncbi:hypothetical protein [Pleomorphovibrio marinus]|uniref:hypothetical protein n=1 Tax=Pleomorphovibrio marinus TaxID=2164132 RepID=UPI000E0C77DF|nr:hypothetical protein [Pleomorphovibrio marinus]
MKTEKNGRFIFTAIIVLSTLFSCMPDENERISTGQQGEIEQLKANAVFDWSTSKPTVVKISGLTEFPVELSRRLNLSDAEGHVYYSGFHPISEDVEVSLVLPNHVKVLKLSFGEIHKEGEIKGGKVNLDYLLEVDDSDIL